MQLKMLNQAQSAPFRIFQAFLEIFGHALISPGGQICHCKAVMAQLMMCVVFSSQFDSQFDMLPQEKDQGGCTAAVQTIPSVQILDWRQRHPPLLGFTGRSCSSAAISAALSKHRVSLPSKLSVCLRQSSHPPETMQLDIVFSQIEFSILMAACGASIDQHIARGICSL